MSAQQSNKLLSEMLEQVLNEVKELKKIIKSHSIDLSIIKETSNLIQLKVSDLSCKADLDLVANITTAKSVAADKKKPTPNVMVYFKLKYATAPESLSAIISAEEIEKVFKDNAAEIKLKGKGKGKKDALLVKLLYTTLIKDSKEKRDMIKAMQTMEESNNTVIETEMVENNIEDDEPAAHSESEEEDDDE